MKKKRRKKPKRLEGRRAFIECLWGAGSLALHRLKVDGRIIFLSLRVLSNVGVVIGWQAVNW